MRIYEKSLFSTYTKLGLETEQSLNFSVKKTECRYRRNFVWKVIVEAVFYMVLGKHYFLVLLEINIREIKVFLSQKKHVKRKFSGIECFLELFTWRMMTEIKLIPLMKFSQLHCFLKKHKSFCARNSFSKLQR